jgi:hypothetical protein
MRLMERRNFEREKLSRAAGVVVTGLRAGPNAHGDDEVRSRAREAIRTAFTRPEPGTKVELVDEGGTVAPRKIVDMAGVFRYALDLAGTDRADQVRQETLIAFVDGEIDYWLTQAGKARADGPGASGN